MPARCVYSFAFPVGVLGELMREDAVALIRGRAKESLCTSPSKIVLTWLVSVVHGHIANGRCRERGSVQGSALLFRQGFRRPEALRSAQFLSIFHQIRGRSILGAEGDAWTRQ